MKLSNLAVTAKNHPDIAPRLAPLARGGGEVLFEHVAEAAHSFFAALSIKAAIDAGKTRQWITCDLPRHRERIAAELDAWGISALVLPEPPVETGDGSIADPESAAEWFSILETLARAETCAVLCAPDAFGNAAPSPAALRSSRTMLQPGNSLDPAGLAQQLAAHGYERVPIVSSRGQFAIRGGILDLFTWQAARPLRLEFFDTDLESIREFDLDSQASTTKLAQADLLLAEPPAESTLAAYFRETDILLAIDPPLSDQQEKRTAASLPITPHIRLLSGPDPHSLSPEENHDLAAYPSPLGTFDAGDFVLDEARRDNFFHQLHEWQRDGWSVSIVFSNKGERDRFQELAGKSLDRDLDITPIYGELLAGFTFPAARLALLSSGELFGRYRTPGTARKTSLERARAAIARATIDEIEEGDLVVHYEYGLARFRGITRDDDGEEISLEFKDGALLGVPLDQAHLVGKYIGLGGKIPDLTKLGGTAWRTARKSAEKSIADYAAQLLRVQAEREHEPGHPHPPDTRWMFEFENSFHYTETADQRRAIQETKHDLEAPRPMDRLICGDVGFGKTEVAIRAVFKAVTGGKQAAILVPTTVLAEQHWRTFRERMSDYPVRVDLLNRFRTPAEIRATIAGLADGSVDIVIGTHRLVSPDVSFKNLGLVVVDEEQRFGVAHKEKFKQLFRQIDVLTLSATPIPRTLYMALMGARDMSTIETPPPNRIPVSTTVCAYDERIIRDAIEREMKRGGQVFFLHNRVKSIEMMAAKLRELVPSARILTGHGQMEKDDLESVMRAFVNGEGDVLLATTIIETGIDIPNANTILIDRADRFGLADLYQLRGRVGRAGEKAYAILLLPRDMVTGGDSRKRIHAIKQYTALGSGFKIAMRDLEIRGAGNLLGTKQSGHVAQIGFELYCQLLKQSVERLKGRQGKAAIEATFKADFLVTREGSQFPAISSQKEKNPPLSPRPRGAGIPPAVSSTDEQSAISDHFPAYLPTSYLPDTTLRITAYRELHEATTEKSIDALETSWRDRHGRLPESVVNLLLVSRVKALASAAGISSVEIIEQRLMLHRNGDYILLEGRRFPRLKAASPAGKLQETLQLLRDF